MPVNSIGLPSTTIGLNSTTVPPRQLREGTWVPGIVPDAVDLTLLVNQNLEGQIAVVVKPDWHLRRNRLHLFGSHLSEALGSEPV